MMPTCVAVGLQSEPYRTLVPLLVGNRSPSMPVEHAPRTTT